MDFKPQNITAEVPIIGFTGALGSGCTYFSTGLEQHYGYVRYGLSDSIHAIAKKVRRKETASNLQDIGNVLRRDYGLDVLVKVALEAADGKWMSGKGDKPRGIVLDGIRNAGEVKALKQFPNFYLISVHAEEAVRRARVVGKDPKYPDEKTFREADRRDAEERA